MAFAGERSFLECVGVVVRCQPLRLPFSALSLGMRIPNLRIDVTCAGVSYGDLPPGLSQFVDACCTTRLPGRRAGSLLWCRILPGCSVRRSSPELIA